MTYTLDVEMFISEVKKYPEIWDLNHAEHRFMKKKQAAWAEIARIFMSDFDDMSDTEKNEVYKKLHSKWRNIRDSFVRNTKRNSGKGYMYAKHLSFLNTLYNNKTHSDSDDQNCWSEDESGTKKARYKTRHIELAENWNEDEETSSTIDNLRRKRSLQDAIAIDYVETPLLADATCSSAEDEDKSFFDSLLPAVRNFNMDQKLEFRSEVILLIKNIRNNCGQKRFKQDPSGFDSAFQ